MKKFWNDLKENWRMADGPDGIAWPILTKPSAQTMFGFMSWCRPFGAWGFSASLTGAWGRPYLWIGPFLVVF